MKRVRKLAVLILVISMASITMGGPTLWGADTLSAGTGITGVSPSTNPWLIDTPLTTMSWWVTDNDNGTFTYKYTLTVPRKDISHFIIEVSPTFTSANILEVLQGSATFGYYGNEGNSNPGIPEQLYGIKTGSGDLSYTLEFISNRSPVWGDFYAKDGSENFGAGDKIDVAIWNVGFTANDSDYMSNHIGVPDSTNPIVPAPGALLLGMIGTGLVGYLRRRRTV